MGFIYHERQLGGLCGVHCLNNLLQGPHFGPGDLAEIGVQLDQQERQLLEEASDTPGAASSGAVGQPVGSAEDGGGGEGGGVGEGGGGGVGGGSSSSTGAPREAECYNVDPSADGGNFSIQVLTVALQRFNLSLLPAKHPAAKQPMQDPGAATEAFLCQYRDHWFAVRQVADCWWNLNSTRKRPAMVGPFYLAAWLSQLTAEGYSIFLLQGDQMPEPVKPRDPNSPEENFHEIFDLLEKAKESGGNPLAGGGDEIDERDAEVAARLAAEGWEEPQPSGPSGLYEELLHAQMQARQPRRPPPPQSQRLQQGVAEYAMDGAWASQDGAPRRGGAAQGADGAASGGLMQEMLKALQCPCGWTLEEEEVSPARADDHPPPFYDSPSRSAPSGGHGGGGGVGGVGGGSGSARSRALQDDGRPLEAPNAQALLEMGFREPMVRVAQELAHGHSCPPALQLLLQQPGVDPDVVEDGERLGRAIQEAVLSCDIESQEVFRERLLRVVALLSVEEARLRAARPHFSGEAMKDFLESLVRNRVQAWPAEFASAAKMAVEMLAAPPSRGAL